MSAQRAVKSWRAAGRSVLGAQHARRGLPNQDAIAWWPAEGQGPPLIMVLSDGHGSARSFRSEVGARLACETALQVLRELLQVPRSLFPLELVRRGATERMPDELVRRWRAAVGQHLEQVPIKPEELAALETRGAAVKAGLEANPYLAYGATLVATAVDPAFLLHVQLGDGDILTVSAAGAPARPLPGDARLFANETTSLCTDTAAADMRICFEPRDGSDPALLVLSTDGYVNSFRTDADFLQVGPDLLSMLQSDGLDPVAANLETWLAEASRDGSGDDVTVGLLYRMA